VEKSLHLTAEDGSTWDASAVQVKGAFVLDMIGHNNNHDRDVFQIASGEGAGSARLALAATWPTSAGIATRVKQPCSGGAGPRAAHARRQTGCRRPSRRCPCPARCGSNGSRARRCTTPTGRSFRIWAFRWCSSWKTTTSPHRVPRHRRHHEEHRPGLCIGGRRHRHRERSSGGNREAVGSARCAIRSFTTESTGTTEAGRKGFRIRFRTLLPHPSLCSLCSLW